MTRNSTGGGGRWAMGDEIDGMHHMVHHNIQVPSFIFHTTDGLPSCAGSNSNSRAIARGVEEGGAGGGGGEHDVGGRFF